MRKLRPEMWNDLVMIPQWICGQVGLAFRDHVSQLNLLSPSSTIFCAGQTTSVVDCNSEIYT